ncbi:MAG: ABC transporter permease [Dehalococcoidia bacterium]|nr:ABC transporter permease [Dehalococcoidia bacterium]
MNFTEGVKVALRGLAANKMRAALTMLGMIIGVSAVITLMAVGNGAQATITASIQSIGTNLLFVRPGASQQGGVASAQGSRPTLTYEDSLALAQECTACAELAPELDAGGQVTAGSSNVNTRIIGATPEYSDVRNYLVAEGDFITVQQVEAASLVAVLGANVATSLFPDRDPIGQYIRVNRINFQVIGVLVAKGSQGMGSQDDQVVVPLTTVARRLVRNRTAQGGTSVDTINIQMTDGTAATQELATQQITDILIQRHKVFQADFSIGSQADLLATANQITGILTLLLGSVAGISLLVGGIGIMNIMLVSVTERTREIGIRKAIGARRRDILSQFLIESAVVSIVGGAAGILLGWGFAQILSHVSFGTSSLNAVVTPDAVALASGVSAAIGLFFGIYPATRAARLNPIDALRYE